jgi:N-acetylmuramoyl-L-alanine amidase
LTALSASAAYAAADEHPGCVPGRFRIALDIGHYRAAPGATSATGVSEFDYNLALARKVGPALNAAGFTAITLVGEAGTPLQLQERTRIAQAAGAVLFISLHHDSVQPRYLTNWTVDGRSERYSDMFHGYSIFVSDRNRDPVSSLTFAKLLGEALLSTGLTPSLHHAEPIEGEGRPLLDSRLGIYRFDGLMVLRTATMPAVLLESAVIVNRAEEQRVKTGEYHAKVVSALVQAVRSYCTGYAAPPAARIQ